MNKSLSSTPAARVSVTLQQVANELDAHLRHQAGARCAFILVLQTPDGVMQHVTNSARPDVAMMLHELVGHWRDGRADIPAHYNFNLPAAAKGGA